MTDEKTQRLEDAKDWHPEQETETLRDEVKQRVEITGELESEISKQLIQEVFCTIGLREANKLPLEITIDERQNRLDRVGQLLNAGIRGSGTLASPKTVMQSYHQRLSSEDAVLVLEGMLAADMVTRRGRRGAAVLRSIAELEEKPLEEVITEHADLIVDLRERLSETYELEESINYTAPIDRGMEDLGRRWDNKEKTYVSLKSEK